jgi:hypothetical protein
VPALFSNPPPSSSSVSITQELTSQLRLDHTHLSPGRPSLSGLYQPLPLRTLSLPCPDPAQRTRGHTARLDGHSLARPARLAVQFVASVVTLGALVPLYQAGGVRCLQMGDSSVRDMTAPVGKLEPLRDGSTSSIASSPEPEAEPVGSYPQEHPQQQKRKGGRKPVSSPHSRAAMSGSMCSIQARTWH